MKPVRVGIIGAGNVLWAYLQVLDRLTPRGLASAGPVCARRRENWTRLRERRPGIELVDGPAEVLRSDVDVVVIITSPESHAALTRLALEHDKHVVVEKPLAESYGEAESLAQMAQDRCLHLLCAPFVQLAPTFRALWSRIRSGAIGTVHSARGLYGNAGSTWARWYHEVGPVSDIGIYNFKSLTSILGPVVETLAAEATAVRQREIGEDVIETPNADVSHVILRHEDGALASIVTSHAIQRYRRPALELYGTGGTANLLGDDWDPQGFELWRNESGCWEQYEPIEPTWLWADGLAEMVTVLQQGGTPLYSIEQDLHLLEVIEACGKSAKEKRAITVHSRFRPIDLRLEERKDRHHLHDHTRPADEQ